MRSGSFALIIFIVTVCPSVWAAGGDMGGGDGSEGNPYLIEDLDDFDAFATDPDYWASGVHTKLMTDIDLSGRTYTTAVIAPDTTINGNFSGTPFFGIFDGNGYCISNLRIDTTTEEGLGLFGGNIGFIQNLGLENLNITCTKSYIGGLCGWNTHGFINNCYTTGQICGSGYLGGLCGSASSMSNITNCYSTCEIVATNNYAGGLCGYNSGSITCCYSTGEVSGTDYTGGLCGTNSESIVSCFWDIETSGITTSSGGIGKTTEQMQDIQTFLTAGWDIVNESANGTSNFWKFSTNEYPSLSVFAEDFNFHSFSGSGTDADPYLITNSADLGAIWQQSEKCFRLANNINLVNIQWSTAPVPFFTGSFSGNNNTISNLTISGGGFLGFFGRIKQSSSISILRFEDVTVTGTGNYIGTVCGWNDESFISNCYSTIVDVSGTGSNSGAIGGLSGFNLAGAIANCGASGTVNGLVDTGGVCGVNAFGVISGSYFNGSVSGVYKTGGLCGNNLHSPDSIITNCYVNGIVNGSGDKIGGLCGHNSIEGIISKCYTDCEVTGTGATSKWIGGLCGYNEGGFDDICTISDCYAKGVVSGYSYVGGLCGTYGIITCFSTCNVNSPYSKGGLCPGSDEPRSDVINSFWDIEASGITTSSGGTGCTTAQMQTQSTFTNWDFLGETANGTMEIWRMCADGIDYPHLSWEYSINGDFACPDGVGIDDLLSLSHNWLNSEEVDPDFNYPCDPTFDGVTNLVDYAVLAENWLSY